MVHRDHVRLIKQGVRSAETSHFRSKGKKVWADFGSGGGAFTLALRDVLGSESEIYSIDKDSESLEHQKHSFKIQFPDSKIHFFTHDMSIPIQLPSLDGIIAANSLHYIKDKVPVLQLWRSYLKPSGKLIIVEYNVDEGNMWVPYPFSFETLKVLAQESGFSEPKFLDSEPSEFLEEIYSAEMRVDSFYLEY